MDGESILPWFDHRILQQLGRGLRLDTGKTSCLVLDFIGNQRREFRFDQRFSALLGGTRQQVVLDLKAQLNANRARMIAELNTLANQLRRPPSLTEYLAETRYEVADVYKACVGGWHALLGEAQQLTMRRTPTDESLAERFHFMLHVDSVRRLRLNLDLLGESKHSLDDLPVLDKRMVEMLTFRLLQNEARQAEWAWAEAIKRLSLSWSAREEFQELSAALLDRVKLHSEEIAVVDNCPLFANT
jgi:glutathione S-transferase